MSREEKMGRVAPGFTLIELLVVIAIIAVLATLLARGLGPAKERGRRAQCIGNERQFIMAALVYAHDHNNLLPVPGVDTRDQNDTHTPVFSSRSATNFQKYTTLKAL